MRGTKWCWMLIGVFMSGEAGAAAIGLPENTARVGYAVGVSRLAMNDPDGSTQTAVDVMPLNLIYTDWLPGGLRYWTEAYYFRTVLDAGPGGLGEKMRRFGARLALQRNMQWGAWSPWLGLGLDLSRSRYSQRYLVDSDGYLLKTLADRSGTALGISAQLVSEWALAQDWDLSAKLEQLIPVRGGIRETSLSVGVLYRY